MNFVTVQTFSNVVEAYTTTFVYFDRQTDFTTICGILALKKRLSLPSWKRKINKKLLQRDIVFSIWACCFCQLEAGVQQCDCGKPFYYHVL